MKKGTIFYFYDALCGWCYGFSPVMMEVYEKYKDEYDFQVISGGMVTGDRVGPIGQVAPYIKDGYKQVEERSGVKFSEAFLKDILEEGTTEFTSIPTAVALSVFKRYKPTEQVAFAARLQKAIYHDAIQPMDTAAYGKLAEEFGINGDEFIAHMQDKKIVEQSFEEFNACKEIGVNGFPTVAVDKGEGKLYAIARGYVPFEMVEENLKNL